MSTELNDKERHRRAVRPFLAAILIQLNIGSLYAWNMISSSLMESYGFSAKSMGVVFGVVLIAFTGSMIPVGRRMNQFTPRFMTLITMILYCGGFAVSGFADGKFPLIMLGNGVLVGLGTGIGYVSSMTFGFAHFNRKSVPTGVITASFAIGSVISAKIIGYLLATGISIDYSLRYLAIGQALALSLAIFLFPKGNKTQGEKKIVPPKIKINNETAVEILPLAIGMFSATFGGLLVISNIKQIVGTLNSSIAIPWAITLFSVGNAAGRILFGALPFKRYVHAIAMMMVLFAIVLLGMNFSASLLVLYILVFLTGIHFGSFFVLFPMSVINVAGSDRFPGIYPFVFFAYGIAAAVSATAGGAFYDRFGSPTYSLYTAAGIEVIGAAAMLGLMAYALKQRTE